MDKITCVCCGYKTLENEGHYEICPICFWEDDPFQKESVEDTGANKVSLIEAQNNYRRFGASEKIFIQNVRKPSLQDKIDPNWMAIHDHLLELKLACKKFKEERYDIKDLEVSLSLIAFPTKLIEVIRQVESELEYIKFTTTNYLQREEAMKVIDTLLEQLNITIEI